MRDSIRPESIMTLLVVVFLADLASLYAWWHDPSVAKENHALEVAQAAMLLAACSMHGGHAYRMRQTRISFLMHAGLALLTLSFALRELDIDRFGDASVWSVVQSTLRTLAAMLWLVFFSLVIRYRKIVFGRHFSILLKPPMSLAILAGVFFIAGWPFDKGLVLHNVAISELAEETLELSGCVILLASSCFHQMAPRRCSFQWIE